MQDEASRDRESRFPRLQPRDILSPAATLLGFVLVSFTYILGVVTDASSLSRFISFLIIAVILLIIAAVFTILSNLLRNETLWRISMAFYAGSWIFFGIITILVLSNSLKLDPFTIELPPINDQLIAASVSVIGSVISLYLSIKYSRVLFKQLLEQYLSSFTNERETIREEVERITTEENKDNEMAFLRVYIDLEKSLRLLAERSGLRKDDNRYYITSRIVKQYSSVGLLSNNFVESFNIIRKMRNEIVHGNPSRKYSEEELKYAMYLGFIMQKELDKILSSSG